MERNQSEKKYQLKTFCGLGKTTVLFKPEKCKRIIRQEEKEARIAKRNDDKPRQLDCTFRLAEGYYSLKHHARVISYCKQCIDIAKEIDDKRRELKACFLLVKTYNSTKQYDAEAVCYSKRCIDIAEDIGDKESKLEPCYVLVRAYGSCNQYASAIIYINKYIDFAKDTGNQEKEIKAYYLAMITNDLLEQYDANTVLYCQKCIDVTEKTAENEKKLKSCLILVKAYDTLQQYDEIAISYCKKCLDVLESNGDAHNAVKACYLLVKGHGSLEQYDDAIVYAKRYIDIAKKSGQKQSESKGYYLLGVAYELTCMYKDAIDNCMKCADVATEIGDHQGKVAAYLQLGNIYFSSKQYSDAITYSKMCLRIELSIRDRENKLKACHLLVKSYAQLEEYDEDAISCFKKCIEITKQMGDTSCVMECSLHLVKSYFSVREYDEAIHYGKKCIEIAKQTADNNGLIKAYLLLGKVYDSLNRHDDSLLYLRKCTLIVPEKVTLTDIEAYSSLVETCYQIKRYHDVIAYGKSCIDIAHDLLPNQEHALTNVYYFLGEAYFSLREYEGAVKYCEKCVDAAKQAGDKPREMDSSLLLANACYSMERYDDAVIHGKKCNEIANQMGDKICEMETDLLVGKSYFAVKKYKDAIDYVGKCIDTAQATGYIKMELQAHEFQAQMFLSMRNGTGLVLAISKCLVLGEQLRDSSIDQAVLEIMYAYLEHQEDENLTADDDQLSYQTPEGKVVLEEIETATLIEKLFALYKLYIDQKRTHQYEDAIPSLEQIRDLELGSMKIFLESFCHEKLGRLYLHLDQGDEAIGHFRLGMSRAREVGSEVISNMIIFKCSRILGLIYFQNGSTEESIKYLRDSICCVDFCIKAVEHHPDVIIDFIDKVNDCYSHLAKGLIKKNRHTEALLVLEQRNARALKENLMAKHGIKAQTRSEEHVTFQDITLLLSTNEYAILFCSVFPDCLYKFLVEKGKGLQFIPFPAPKEHIEHSVEAIILRHGARTKERMLEDVDFQSANVNRSCDIESDLIKTAGRILNYFTSSIGSRGPKEPSENSDATSMTDDLEVLYYKLLDKISIEQDELVIIPDGPLYKVPFAALRDPDTGQYLSERLRTRLAPSIATLKLIEELPVERQCEKHALIIGDPLVGKVIFDGKETEFSPLENAYFEAVAAGKIFNATPLTREKATKRAVQERLKQGASLVQIAAHGSLTKGIALAPSPEIRETKIPDEEDYMLTMADVQQAQVRAQLVVLSCCHSGRGEIRAEGVVGMCRAFLASGARAVVASLWAIDDDATLVFMKQFYKYLNEGKSASTSLHLTMNYMRQLPKYSDPKYWAAFFLMGDDVTINLDVNEP